MQFDLGLDMKSNRHRSRLLFSSRVSCRGRCYQTCPLAAACLRLHTRQNAEVSCVNNGGTDKNMLHRYLKSLAIRAKKAMPTCLQVKVGQPHENSRRGLIQSITESQPVPGVRSCALVWSVVISHRSVSRSSCQTHVQYRV